MFTDKVKVRSSIAIREYSTDLLNGNFDEKLDPAITEFKLSMSAETTNQRVTTATGVEEHEPEFPMAFELMRAIALSNKFMTEAGSGITERTKLNWCRAAQVLQLVSALNDESQAHAKLKAETIVEIWSFLSKDVYTGTSQEMGVIDGIAQYLGA